jgi:hypothetical protein
MTINIISKNKEDIILNKQNDAKVECYYIPVKKPKKIEPGSKTELRYLQYLKHKYSNC